MLLNVLIVDDSVVMRAIVLKTLQLSGLPLGNIYNAGTGDEGLRTLTEHLIDLAFVDLNMPVMGGEEMINRIRENPETANLPIVVVSAEGSETRIDTLRTKGVGFIHKPFMPELLREEVRRITGVSDGEHHGNSVGSGRRNDF